MYVSLGGGKFLRVEGLHLGDAFYSLCGYFLRMPSIKRNFSRKIIQT